MKRFLSDFKMWYRYNGILKAIEYTMIYPVIEPVKIFLERFKRGIAYFKHGFYSIDFDSVELWGDMLFKLKRIQKVVDSSLAFQYSKEAQKENSEHYSFDKKYYKIREKNHKNLQKAIDLIQRLYNDEYEILAKGLKFKETYKNAQRMRSKDIKKLAKILDESGEAWWD